MSSDMFSIKFVCPYCKAQVELTVPKSDVKNAPAGILRIPIEHETPDPHTIIIDIDQSGFIRSSYLIKNYLVSQLPLSEIIGRLSKKKFAYLLGWLFLGDKFYVKGKDKVLVKWVRSLINILLSPGVKVVSDEKEADKRIDLDKLKQPPFTISLFEQYVDIATRVLKDDKVALTFLKSELSRLHKTMKKVEESILKLNRKITLDELMKNLGIDTDKNKLKLVLTILAIRGLDVSKRVSFSEIKIAEVF